MKKETTIAVLFGIILGGVLAVVIISKNKEKQLEKTKAIAPIVTTAKTPVAINSEYKTLELKNPQDGAIFNKPLVSIEGSADKDALIVIQSPIKDLVITNKEGNFSTDFPLALGENPVKIFVYPKGSQSNPQEKELKIYYFDENL